MRLGLGVWIDTVALRPLSEEGADEPLGLAVGLRAMGRGPAVASLAQDGAIGVRAIARPLSVRTRSIVIPSAAKTATAWARAADPLGFGSGRDRPAFAEDAIDQQLATECEPYWV